MFELPEFVTLAAQFNVTVLEKRIKRGSLDHTPHKSVWFNRTPEKFEALTRGHVIGKTYARGKWLFTAINPGYVLVLGECGGRVLYHPPNSRAPKKFHLSLAFEDSAFLTATTQMWGAMELYAKGQEREYIRDMRPTAIEPEFTLEYLSTLVNELVGGAPCTMIELPFSRRKGDNLQ